MVAGMKSGRALEWAMVTRVTNTRRTHTFEDWKGYSITWKWGVRVAERWNERVLLAFDVGDDTQGVALIKIRVLEEALWMGLR